MMQMYRDECKTKVKVTWRWGISSDLRLSSVILPSRDQNHLIFWDITVCGALQLKKRLDMAWLVLLRKLKKKKKRRRNGVPPVCSVRSSPPKRMFALYHTTYNGNTALSRSLHHNYNRFASLSSLFSVAPCQDGSHFRTHLKVPCNAKKFPFTTVFCQ